MLSPRWKKLFYGNQRYITFRVVTQRTHYRLWGSERKMEWYGIGMVNFCVHLTGLRDAQRAGRTLFLGLPVRVLPEGIAYKLINPVRQITLCDVGRHHPGH